MTQPNRENCNRYPGVKPFTAVERELFFGREKDIEDFYSLLFIKQSVVLYGKSGYGKSSLLSAGVIPRLQEEGEWRCYPIRFNSFSERDSSDNVTPVENIKLRLRPGLGANETAFLDAVIPAEDSFWYWLKTIQSAEGLSQFIFFFDQFEELFTYPKALIDEFSEQLSQLLYNTVPVKFRKRLAEMDEAGGIPDELHALLHEKLIVKVVFSIRSDRMALMNNLKDRHPSILQNNYELDALSRPEAEDAIVKPARQPQSGGFCTPAFDYTPGAIRKILDGIAGAQDGKIDTSTLQIVCRYVEDELVGQKHFTTITGDELGNISNIFREYYEGVLGRLGERDRERAQRLIEDELIEDGRRNTLTEGYIRKRFGFDGKLLGQLEQSSLLRKERDGVGRILYEISHDTLVAAIDMVARRRREAEEEQKQRLVMAEEEEKQRQLQASLDEEKRKAQYLTELNRTVGRRSRLAMGLAVVMFLLGGSALYNYFRAVNERRQVKEMAAKIFGEYISKVRTQQ
ncbi:MAG TPA: hypothetical protein VL978_06310, partial [Puia sp.]|nr:hypothetical protein [Puia sp.]